LNVRFPYSIIYAAFIIGLALGFGSGAMGSGNLFSGKQRELRERLEQVNRDLQSAVDSQREAAERAARLQTELQGVTDHARDLEDGTRRAEARTGGLAQQLDGIINQSGELTDGISRAQSNLEESRILLAELGFILRSIP